MPDSPDKDPRPLAVDDDVRTLLREHLRLQRDIEMLLEQQQRLLKPQNGNGNGNGNQSEKKQDEKKQDGKKDEKSEDDEKEEEKPKEPFRQRASAWIHAHPLGVFLICIAVVLLLVGGYFFYQYLQSYVNTDDAEIDGHTSHISSRVSGTVTGVYVEDSRSVKLGQTLVDLDAQDYLNAVQQAEAGLAQAIAALHSQSPNVPITQTSETSAVTTAQLEVTNAAAAVEAAQSTHESALADLQQAQANADNAAAEERRYRDLAGKQEVSREQYDQRATQARSAEAVTASRRAAAEAEAKTVKQRESALAQAQAKLQEAENNRPRQIAVQQSTVAERQSAVEAAKARVAQARLNLSYCKIAAPMDGIIGNKTVEVGQQIAPGDELFAITPVEDIWVTANFKETQIQNMHPGQSVKVHVDAVDLDFDGYVQNMPGATGAKYSLLPPENATGNYIKVVQRLPVRIRLKPNQTGMERLRPGMSVEPKVWLK